VGGEEGKGGERVNGEVRGKGGVGGIAPWLLEGQTPLPIPTQPHIQCAAKKYPLKLFTIF